MNKIIYPLFVSTLMFLAVSCGNGNDKSLTILKITEHGSAKLSDSAIISVLEDQTDLSVKILYELEEKVALKQLANKSIDLAIIPSNTLVKEGEYSVRTVMPLLPRVLMVMTKPGTQAGNLKELLENNVVLYEDMSIMDSLFFKDVFQSFNINPAKVDGELISNSSENHLTGPSSVYIGLTHVHNPFVISLLESGWTFFSLDKVSRYGHGSAAEGFQMSFPWAYPFILPGNFYAGKPEEPVLTVAIRDVLVCREDFNDNTVYKVVGSLIENKANLVRMNNNYTLLETKIDKRNLSFPLHQGTLNYLNRDKPSIWVRYATTIWPVISVIAILLGAAASFHKRLKKRLKERIDKYYAELLHIRSRAINENDAVSREELQDEMQRLRSRAFESLKNNKLVADNSFMIFLRLYQEIAVEIAGKTD